ncbi:hypothetical protein GCM10011519_19910 [Marmoricola endophyticus]|uniref:Uncharacterized protein n=1 Tax=Marmoricola endophyticus TaxID=2040280 RepID=A0A917BJP2_9ACTN|nr:hypothetical protein GCM10011519_19910 [Marmoricola endophyticus]
MVAALLLAGCGSTRPEALVDHTQGLVRPGSIHVESSADHDRAERVVHTAQELYTFWDTGRTR